MRPKLDYDILKLETYVHCSYMARARDREQALRLRRQGKSYSQIKAALGVSKSTLHYWLRDHPLPDRQIRALRDWNPRRIENFRNTMRKKRLAREMCAYERVRKDIGRLSRRDLFLTGFFLYWGEGVKTATAEIGLANTDPAMMRSFIRWLEILGVPRQKLRLRLHLYSDMNIKKYHRFWSVAVGIPQAQFQKPYIKASKRDAITYRGRFGHGTCNVRCYGRDITDYVLMGLKHISNLAST